MRLLASDQFPEFVAAKRAAAIHFDAEWNSRHRDATRQTMFEAEQAFGGQVNFGEVDVDKEAAASIPVANVPVVAYYRDGKLIAALIGAGQNVQARLDRVLRGESVGYKDGTSAVKPNTAPGPHRSS